MSVAQGEGLPAGFERRPWWRWERFRLVPEWGYRPEDEQNRMDWWFSWLCVRVWSMMSPDIGLGVGLDDQDLEVRVYLPYVIIRLAVPIFPQRFHQKTWRTKPWPRIAE